MENIATHLQNPPQVLKNVMGECILNYYYYYMLLLWKNAQQLSEWGEGSIFCFKFWYYIMWISSVENNHACHFCRLYLTLWDKQSLFL